MDNTTEIAKLLTSLGDWQRWILVPLIALLFGSLGGWTKRLTTPTTEATPTTERLPLKNYLIVGAVASIVVLFVLTPTDGVKLIAQSIAAGYVGQVILDSIADRIKLALKVKENEEIKKMVTRSANLGLNGIKLSQNRVNQSIGDKNDLDLIQGELQFLESKFNVKPSGKM